MSSNNAPLYLYEKTCTYTIHRFPMNFFFHYLATCFLSSAHSEVGCQKNCFRTHAHPDELVSDVIQLDVHVVLRVVNVLPQLQGERRQQETSALANIEGRRLPQLGFRS
jgi:hypothetical protein